MYNTGTIIFPTSKVIDVHFKKTNWFASTAPRKVQVWSGVCQPWTSQQYAWRRQSQTGVYVHIHVWCNYGYLKGVFSKRSTMNMALIACLLLCFLIVIVKEKNCAYVTYFSTDSWIRENWNRWIYWKCCTFLYFFQRLDFKIYWMFSQI